MWNWQSQLFGGGSGTGARVSRTQSRKRRSWSWTTCCHSRIDVLGRADECHPDHVGAASARIVNERAAISSALHADDARNRPAHAPRRTDATERQQTAAHARRAALATLGVLAASAPAFAADAALIAAAKKEGEVTWYTTQIITQFGRPAVDAFQKKYGIRVNCVRGDSVELAVRMLNEGQGRPHAGRRVRRHRDRGRPSRRPASPSSGCPTPPSDGRRNIGIARAIGSPPTSTSTRRPSTPTSSPRAPSRRPCRICSTRNGRARWPGPRTRPPPARPASSAWC